jgi:recombination protein RecR
LKKQKDKLELHCYFVFINLSLRLSMSNYPSSLLSLIAFLKKLPGVGSKTAERFAFRLLHWPQDQLSELANHIQNIKERIVPCAECHCLMEEAPCTFCDPLKRDTSLLCVISSPKDVFSIEETRSYRGLYHVIEGLLSPMDGRSADYLQLDKLKKRIGINPIKEIIIALDSTIEGDATALYLKEHLKGPKISRLAFGLPIGSTLDFVDGGTLSRSFTGRHSF